MPVADDPAQRVPRLGQIRRFVAEPAQTGIGVGHDRGERLIDLVGNGRGDFSHHGRALHARQFGLHRLQRLLRTPALGNVDDRGEE